MKNHLKTPALLLLAAVTLFSAQPGTVTYRDSKMGISTVISSDWQPRRRKDHGSSPKCIEFMAKAIDARDPVVYIEVFDQGLEKTITEHVLFKRENGAWVKHGRFSTATAKPIRVKHLDGIYAVADCGISDEETGFHAAAGECLTAFISNGKRTAVVESNGVIDTNKVLDTLVKNFRFLK